MRSALGVAGLPFNVSVEIEGTFCLRNEIDTMDPLGNWSWVVLILSLYLLHPIVLPGYAQLFHKQNAVKVRMPLFAFPVAEPRGLLSLFDCGIKVMRKSFLSLQKSRRMLIMPNLSFHIYNLPRLLHKG